MLLIRTEFDKGQMQQTLGEVGLSGILGGRDIADMTGVNMLYNALNASKVLHRNFGKWDGITIPTGGYGSGVWSRVQFTNEIYKANRCYSDSSGTRFKCNQAGHYDFTSYLHWTFTDLEWLYYVELALFRDGLRYAPIDFKDLLEYVTVGGTNYFLQRNEIVLKGSVKLFVDEGEEIDLRFYNEAAVTAGNLSSSKGYWDITYLGWHDDDEERMTPTS